MARTVDTIWSFSFLFFFVHFKDWSVLLILIFNSIEIISIDFALHSPQQQPQHSSSIMSVCACDHWSWWSDSKKLIWNKYAYRMPNSLIIHFKLSCLCAWFYRIESIKPTIFIFKYDNGTTKNRDITNRLKIGIILPINSLIP